MEPPLEIPRTPSTVVRYDAAWQADEKGIASAIAEDQAAPAEQAHGWPKLPELLGVRILGIRMPRISPTVLPKRDLAVAGLDRNNTTRKAMKTS